MPPRLGHRHARNERGMAAGAKEAVLSVRKNVRSNHSRAGLEREVISVTNNANSEPVDLKLEVVVIGVSDVDRAKAFYEKLGWRMDGDFVIGDDFRAVQLTPPNSQASVIFGKGIASPKPGSVN